jgi:hypothetical protein
VFKHSAGGINVWCQFLFHCRIHLIQNSLAVEVVLVTENTTDWNDRLRFQIPANASAMRWCSDKFTNPLGQKYNNEKIKGIVFSVQRNYQVFNLLR